MATGGTNLAGTCWSIVVVGKQTNGSTLYMNSVQNGMENRELLLTHGGNVASRASIEWSAAAPGSESCYVCQPVQTRVRYMLNSNLSTTYE